MTARIYCSFCGKSDLEALEIITAESVAICDECVALCVEIITEHRKTMPAVVTPPCAHDTENPLSQGIADACPG